MYLAKVMPTQQKIIKSYICIIKELKSIFTFPIYKLDAGFRLKFEPFKGI
jgi:hypothetical protein